MTWLGEAASQAPRARRSYPAAARCFAALVGLLLLVGGCGSPERSPPEPAPCPPGDAAVRSATPLEVRHASGFTVRALGTATLVTVLRPYAGSTAPLDYLLLPCGTVDPGGLPDALRIRTPVHRVVTTATTQLAHLEALDLLDRVVGHTNLHYVYSAEARRLVATGHIAEAGIGPRLERESLLALAPEVVFTFSLGPAELTEQQRLREVGLTPVVNADYTEVDPLGRAEWLLFTALFFGREAEAVRQLREVERSYLTLRQRAAAVTHRPAVFTSAPYRGTWWMPGGATHAAQLFADAGADYLWRDPAVSSTLALGLEEVLMRAGRADAWMNPGLFASLGELLTSDERMAEFQAFRSGQVYNFDARTTPQGGNDYWETGLVRPDLVLADLVSIFHPELLPAHDLYFHRQLPPEGNTVDP